MSTEQRRAMIVAAALPLVAEHGAAVTTNQIARAAGIGEGTVFRAFGDKDELLDACLAEAMNPGHLLRELASISLEEPLADRLTQAAEALAAHLGRMGTVIGALHGTGHRRDRTRGVREDGAREGDRPSPGGREASMTATREAIVDLIEPDRASLRLEPERIASVFLGMLFTRSGAPSPGELVDILLHGTLKNRESAA